MKLNKEVEEATLLRVDIYAFSLLRQCYIISPFNATCYYLLTILSMKYSCHNNYLSQNNDFYQCNYYN